MQNVDAAFYYLANEFYKLYQDKLEMFKAMSWYYNATKYSLLFRPTIVNMFSLCICEVKKNHTNKCVQ